MRSDAIERSDVLAEVRDGTTALGAILAGDCGAPGLLLFGHDEFSVRDLEMQKALVSAMGHKRFLSFNLRQWEYGFEPWSIDRN